MSLGFGWDEVGQRQNAGLISVRPHEERDLFVLNYTAACQYSRAWDDVTMTCRGLIVDGDCIPVARPFPKFFNIGEPDSPPIPNEPFDVYEKVDGSLFVVAADPKDPDYVVSSTRGSFYSDQATYGRKILEAIDTTRVWSPPIGVTAVFELIHPDNRIVVNYGDREDLVLLAFIDNETGEDLPLDTFDWPGPVVRRLPFSDVQDVLNECDKGEFDNSEGFVIRFQSGLRLKAKKNEYIRLHKVITGLSETSVWEALRDGSISQTLNVIPDEYMEWVRDVADSLTNKFVSIEKESEDAFRTIVDSVGYADRKSFALKAVSHPYRKILFSMYDNREYSSIIWGMIKPKTEGGSAYALP